VYNQFYTENCFKVQSTLVIRCKERNADIAALYYTSVSTYLDPIVNLNSAYERESRWRLERTICHNYLQSPSRITPSQRNKSRCEKVQVPKTRSTEFGLMHVHQSPIASKQNAMYSYILLE